MPSAPKKKNASTRNRPGPAKEAAKLAAALLLAQGVGPVDIAKEHRVIGRTTLWRLLKADTDEGRKFVAMVEGLKEKLAASLTDDVVAGAVADLRALAPLAVQAFEDGLRANVRYTTAKGEEGVVTVALPDRSLAVRTADLVTKRIAELIPRSGQDVHVTGTLETRIKEFRERGIEPPD